MIRIAVLIVGLLTASFVSPAETPGKPDLDRALQTSQAALGREIGDHRMQDRLYREFKFRDYRGKPLVVSFAYTGCFQVCPTATQFLAGAVASARQALGADSFNVLTIGFNQPFDTPEAMAAFARQNGIRDASWEFASASEQTIQLLTSELGFTYYRTAAGFDHLAQVSVIDADGVVYRQIYGDSFALPMLVAPLKELLTGQAVRRGGFDGLWDKVKLFCTVYDPGSGNYRVNYSLFLEIFAGLSILSILATVYIKERRRSRNAGLVD
jgi:protein SCO1/2